MTGPLGPSVLVTGSNRGLGLAIVRELLKLNGIENIFAACRTPSDATELNKLTNSYKSITVVKLDVENDDDIAEAVKIVERKVGKKGLNVLINSAAILTEKSAESDRNIMNSHMSVNIVSPVMITNYLQTFLPLLQQDSSANKPSLVVNTSSGSVADVVWTVSENIVMTKAALNKCTRYLSSKLSHNHIVAIAVHPGWIRTDMGTSAAPVSAEDSACSLLQTLQFRFQKEKQLPPFPKYDP